MVMVVSPDPTITSDGSTLSSLLSLQDSRSASAAAERAAARMSLRQPHYPLYHHQDFRDGVQVLSVGGRSDGVHVVAPPPSSLPNLHAHPGLGHPDTKRQRLAEPHALPPLRIETRESKVGGVWSRTYLECPNF